MYPFVEAGAKIRASISNLSTEDENEAYLEVHLLDDLNFEQERDKKTE